MCIMLVILFSRLEQLGGNDLTLQIRALSNARSQFLFDGEHMSGQL